MLSKHPVVSARVHPKTKEKLARTGYNARDAIEYFVKEYYSNNPQKKIKIKRDIIELKLKSLKHQECEIQVEISSLEKQLESLAIESAELPEDNSFIMEEEDDDQYPVEVIEALELVQGAFDTKRDLLVSPKTDVREAVDSFIVMHGDVVQNAFKMCKGLNWKEFREVLLGEIK